jgi:hypothetical protein
VGGSSGSGLTPTAILLMSGAALLLLSGASSWRYRRLAGRSGEPPSP